MSNLTTGKFYLIKETARADHEIKGEKVELIQVRAMNTGLVRICEKASTQYPKDKLFGVYLEDLEPIGD